MLGPNEVYDAVRCRTCGVPWPVHTDICCRHPYRPAPDPAPVDRARRRRHAWEERHGNHAQAVPAAGTASSLPATVDQAEIARRELEGAAPTREWVVPLRGEPPNLFVGKVAFPDGAFQPVGRGLYEAIQEAQINAAANGKGGPDVRPRTDHDDLYDQ